MKMAVLFVITTIASISLNIGRTNAYSNEDQLLMDAGCKYDRCGGTCDAPKWHGYGTLLEKGACIEKNVYRKSVVPEKGITKVYTTFTEHKVRQVHDGKKEVTIDFTLKMQWIDPGIKTNFSEEDIEQDGIVLEVEQLNLIWKPDLYIYNLTDYKSYYDSKQIKSFILLPSNQSNLEDKRKAIEVENRQTIVQLALQAKATIYCDFDLNFYPMDNQTCQLRFGSRSSGTPFTLHDPNQTYHQKAHYQAENFNIEVTIFDGKLDNGKNTIGLDIRLDRILKPFFMEYYLPCMAIVFVSQIGFAVPLTAIPGRVALLVTQFLTITNLFIHQMVCVLWGL